MDPAIQPAPQNPPPAAPPPAAPAAPPAPAPGEALAKPVQTVAQPPAAKPGEQPAPKPGDKPGDKPAEKPAPVAVDAKWRPAALEGVKRDDALMAKTAETFAKLGLNTEQADALVKYSDELAKLGSEASKAAEESALKEQNAGWWKELQADKEIGAGSDDGLKANLVIANKAVDALFGEEGRKAIQEAGLTNWPPLVRAMVRAGAKIGEDTLLDGGKAAPPLTSELEKMKQQYPKSPELWDPNHPEFRGRK
jgi:hypothetical protein